MRITQILPGSGGTFYCENCMRDSALARHLIQSGHDVTLMPMYLPIYSDDPALAEGTPIFFGGINAYLQQKLPIFRHTPRWLDRLFDARWVLQIAAKRAGSTRASDLGDMTFSMLQGSEGHQAKEVERMLTWLEAQPTPDVIHVSSVLLLGLAPEIKRRLSAPLVYTSMDEDTWLDELPQPAEPMLGHNAQTDFRRGCGGLSLPTLCKPHCHATGYTLFSPARHPHRHRHQWV